MASEVKLPKLGENVQGGDVVDVLIKPGDEVTAGQALIEVEAEKSSVPVPSPLAGKVLEVRVKKGDKVQAGQTLCTIESKNGAPAAAKPESKPEAPKAEAPKPSPAAAAQQPAPTPAPAKPAPTPAPAPTQVAEGGVVPAGPATRRYARDLGVDLTQVPGTGVKGRVSVDDVKNHIRTLAAGGGGGGGIAVPNLPNFETWGPIEAKPFESIRKRTAEHVSLCWNLIPHVTQQDLADVTEIEAFRKQQEGKGPKLTVTAFALKATAILLKQFPQFNSSLDTKNGQIIQKNYIHIGIAVDTEKGLVVPVIRDVDKKSVQEVAKETGEIAEKARQRKLTADDMQGGTFTISNLGGLGGTGFSPIVNWPQVAILGLSRSRQQPVWKNDTWVPRLMLPLSLSYDHRVIDGADAARFCRKLADLLENPLVMLIHA